MEELKKIIAKVSETLAQDNSPYRDDLVRELNHALTAYIKEQGGE